MRILETKKEDANNTMPNRTRSGESRSLLDTNDDARTHSLRTNNLIQFVLGTAFVGTMAIASYRSGYETISNTKRLGDDLVSSSSSAGSVIYLHTGCSPVAQVTSAFILLLLFFVLLYPAGSFVSFLVVI